MPERSRDLQRPRRRRRLPGLNAGPAGTTTLGAFVFLAPHDPAAIDAFVGVVVAADPAAPEAGTCQIGFAATLTPAALAAP